jgi:aminobenzoyl-glutamate utilization protein B
VSNLLANTPLEQAMHDNMQRLGPPLRRGGPRLRARSRARCARRTSPPPSAGIGLEATDRDKPLCDRIVPLDAKGEGDDGLTDVGDVSWKVPTVQARGATYAIGTPGHSWQLTAQGKSGIAHKGMVHVAKVMAGTAVDAIRNPALLAAAKADHKARTDAHPYVCPLPPPIE